jgi:hypothetical protein
MKGIRVPGPLQVSTRFFGTLTVPDIIRIGVPLGIALLVTYSTPFQVGSTVLWLAAGGLIGVIWYGFRPYDRTLDIHLYQLLRWAVLGNVKGRQVSNGNDVDKENEGGEVSDGQIITDTGVAIGVIQVEPTNLEMKTGAEQGALHSIYRELFETVTYPVTVHSRQHWLDLTNYVQQLLERESPHPQLKEDYIDYCKGLSGEQIVSTQHYLVLRVESNQNGVFGGGDEVEARSRELDSRIQDVILLYLGTRISIRQAMKIKIKPYYHHVIMRFSLHPTLLMLLASGSTNATNTLQERSLRGA